jgi:DNA primase
MVRAPDGVDGQLFFQKHLDRYKMEGVSPLDPKIFPGHPAMLEIAQPKGLLSAAQMNVVEFHTWNSVASASDTPDRMTFDLDPGEGVGWPRCRRPRNWCALPGRTGLPGLPEDQRRQGAARGGADQAEARTGTR